MATTQQQQQQQDKKTILVFGATGKQGGSVIKALQHGDCMKKYQVRGVTRNKDQSKISTLESIGVQMVKADICTGEGIEEAFKGVWAAFLLTHSFEKGIEGNEFDCAKRLVDIAYNNGVKVLVWSSSPNAHNLSSGKFWVPQYTEKAKVEEYIKSLQKEKKAFDSVSFISLTFYYQNFHHRGFSPKKESDGSMCFKFPDVRNLIACDVHDVGKIFCQILKDPTNYNGKEIELSGDRGNIDQYIQTFERVTGQKTKLQKIAPDELAKCPELHHGKQLAEMFKFLNENPQLQTMHPNSIRASDIIKVKSFGEWLQETGWKGEVGP
jgi:nucleoside-diphosphate-sugar epimerase